MWGTPMLLPVGIALLHFAAKSQRPVLGKRFRIAFAVVFLLPLACYFSYAHWGPEVRGKASRTHFPGREFSKLVTERWKERFDQPFKNVVSDIWLGSIVGWYGQDRPLLYIGGDPRRSPWLDDKRLQREGGMVLWLLHDEKDPGDSVTAPIFTDFIDRLGSKLIFQSPIIMAYPDYPELPLIRIGVAFLPPDET